MRVLAAAVALATLALAAGPALAEEPKSGAAEPAKTATVEEGRKVSIEYTLTLDDGEQADSNVGGQPLVFEQGKHQILPALEKALSGMKASESRKVTLAPEEGYGKVMPELIQEVDPKLIPEEARVAGTELAAEDPQGNRHFARVHEVREDKILVDMNHPLAGRTLHFDVKILSID
jgi:FKBP-type peptidyl-prolyl cis-trans isomerase 2